MSEELEPQQQFPEILTGSDIRFFRDERGLFQPGPAAEVAEVRETIDSYLSHKKLWPQMPISTYQAWGRLDWKQPHYSWEATERFGSGLWDEETPEALAEFSDLGPEHMYDKRAINPEAQQRLVSELGDVLWYTSAVASQLKIDLEDVTVHHTLNLSGQARKPLLVGDIDLLVEGGVRPRVTDNLYNDEDTDLDGIDPWGAMTSLNSFVKNFAFKSYGYGEGRRVGEPGPGVNLPANTLELFGRIVYFTGYFAHRWGQSSLSHVVETNVRKLTERVQTDTIDRPRA